MNQTTRALAVLALVATGFTAAAAAGVTLETSVSRVETTLDPAGRVKRELLPVDEGVLPGEELRYTITFVNDSDTLVEPGRIVVTNAIPEGTRYVAGSAGGSAASVEYSTDGETFEPTEPAGESPAAAPAGAAAPAENGPRVRSLRWTHQEPLAPGESAEVFFHVRMQ
jgi:uncharacterized repeat protein (TIGR01451 family)